MELRKKSYYSFLLFLALLSSSLSAVNIAITFDDHPMSEGKLFTLEERTERFISACKNNHCQAAFFCIGNCCNSAKELNSLQALSSAGHFIANHSMNHLHFSKISLEQFEKEIEQTDQILKGFTTMRKWFRYPFLDYGNRQECGGSLEKAKLGCKIMQKLNYTEGYVTINTFDWHINSRLNQALNLEKRIDYEALKSLYLTLIKKWCCYYIGLYQNLSQKEVTHTLLLHANDLNALYLNDILQMLTGTGWKIISAEIAMQETDWLARKLGDPACVISKPANLDCHIIDELLEQADIFK